MYVAVKGGEKAIAAAHALLHEERRGPAFIPEIGLDQIGHQLKLAVDRVMAEASLYCPRLAALAIKQAAGDLQEAIFLLRAYRTTLPRFAASLPLETDCMRQERRISATWKDLPGGQVLGSTFDYTHRLLDRSLDVPAELKDTVALHSPSWLDVAAYLTDDSSLEHRTARVERITKETSISIEVDLDGTGEGHIATGIGFLDHMLDQLVRHSRIDMEGSVKGDLNVDCHHTAEDTALALGEAVRKALGDKRGIERYGSEIVMMDDTAATAAIDFSGRPDLLWDVSFTMEYIGSFPSELIRHFFRSFSAAAGCNIYLSATPGGDSHHTAEALFKAFARSVRKAVRRIPGDQRIASTKGTL